jgi:thioredoxin-like negative regulator of GroEL
VHRVAEAQILMRDLLKKLIGVEAEDISIENGVDALPTIQFFQEGKMIGEFKGSDTSGVEKVIRCFVKKSASP